MNDKEQRQMLIDIRAMCLGTVIFGIIAWSQNPVSQTAFMIISVSMCVISSQILRKEDYDKIPQRMIYLIFMTIILTLAIEIILIIQSKDYDFFEYGTLMFLIVQNSVVLTKLNAKSKLEIVVWVLLIICLICAIFA